MNPLAWTGGGILAWTMLLQAPAPPVVGADEDLDTALMLATVKVSTPETTGTAFILGRPPGPDGGAARSVLVTARHTFERARGNEVTVAFHRRTADGIYTPFPTRVPLRHGGKPLWVAHPSADVAVLEVTPPAEVPVPAVPVDLLATDADLKRLRVHPGEAIRCVGFPHPNQFDSGPGGFAVVRSGCIASYPLLPTATTRTFIADLNVFEGDSGAAVYLSDPDRPVAGAKPGAPARLILGLVTGQHFIDEEFRMIYQSGKFRHRMALAVVVHASTIRETIDRLPRGGTPDG